MNFTLVYWNTDLKGSGNRSRTREKHKIRRDLSAQIESLCALGPVLQFFDLNGDIRKAIFQSLLI